MNPNKSRGKQANHTQKSNEDRRVNILSNIILRIINEGSACGPDSTRICGQKQKSIPQSSKQTIDWWKMGFWASAQLFILRWTSATVLGEEIRKKKQKKRTDLMLFDGLPIRKKTFTISQDKKVFILIQISKNTPK